MNFDTKIELVAEQALWAGLSKSVHGDSHWRRTFLLAEMIMAETGGHRHIVGYSALMHDIGRLHSDPDRNHGYRGASFAIRIAGNDYANSPLSTNEFYGTMVILGKIAEIVSRHCLPDIPDYLEMQIVHDANILDRVRFNGRDSIDVSRFALPDVSEPLIDAALELLDEEPVAEPVQSKVIQLKREVIIPRGRL